MRGLALLLLAQVTPLNLNEQPIIVKDEGVRQGTARATVINCSGAGVTCTQSGTTMTMTIPGGGSSGGYDGGKVGEAYAADASITAQTFDHNPTDCAATEYATAIDSAGNLTCSTPPGGGGSGLSYAEVSWQSLGGF